jgi:hypothetical protein
VKKLVIFLVAGLALGLAASTGVVAFLARGEEPLTESLEDALADAPADDFPAGPHTAAQRGEDEATETEPLVLSGHADGEVLLLAPDGVARPYPVSQEQGGDTGAAALGEGAAGGTEHPIAAPVRVPGGPSPIEADRLAKMFGQMQARDAAKVLEHLDDYEVQVILGQLGNREAAAILSNLSPERAAVISSSVIRAERSQR